MAAETSTRGLVDAALTLSGGMLDEGHHAAGHEAATPHGVPGAGHLRDLDDAPPSCVRGLGSAERDQDLGFRDRVVGVERGALVGDDRGHGQVDLVR